MMTVDVGHSSLQYRQTRSPGRLAWFEGRQPLGTDLHSSDEADELLYIYIYY